ncbi:thioredoxin family protein [Metabacillus iocasae]|uniref:Thiol-disulfide isomerase/thioredoxin n=1 Tax=Priestia iocasae TaxID=2291674 RepID=A0ABS2QZ99_9BACI|nr:thioredoxin family protein [Metabacillus iocasae]MBM7704573.1 thiol-disulfide isomerase/thioredoxin [Metabacillus iocasae]
MQEWTEQQLKEKQNEHEQLVIFFYTPLCGTCQVSKKMLAVVEQLLPHLNVGMCNLNYMPNQAEVYEIESVPCLIVLDKNKVQKKLYAFHSVEYLLNELKE